MKKWAEFFLGALLFLPESGMAQAEPKAQKSPKTMEMYIQTDLPPPPSAEEVMPEHPFFAAPSTGNELLGKVEELEERVSKLEAKEQEHTQREGQNSSIPH